MNTVARRSAPVSVLAAFSAVLLVGAAEPLASAAQSKRATNRSAPMLRPFDGSYDEALARALERNVPLIAVAIAEEHGKELDPDIQEFRDSLFSASSLTSAAELAVVLMSSNGVHPPKTIEVQEGDEKTTRQVCSVYRTSTCQAHQRQFDRVYAEHNVEGEMRSPSVFLIGVDRKLARAWSTGSAPSWDAVTAAQSELQKKLGEGLRESQYDQILALLPQGRSAANLKQWGAAHLVWGKVLAITTATKYAEEARSGQKTAEAELEKARAAARAGLEQGQGLESYKALLALQREWAGTSFEKDLARDVAGAEKHKLAKDAIAAYKRELEAEQLWNDAAALLARGDEKGAHSKLRSILKKFAGTPAEARVRERFAALAADEDAKRSKGS